MKEALFAVATRERYRFSYKGSIGVEDLWDLSVTALDSIYKGLNRERKQEQEDSLLNVKNEKDTVLDNKIEIVKYIVSVKQKEAAERLEATEKAKMRQRIMELKAKKQDEVLANMSEEELDKMLAEL